MDAPVKIKPLVWHEYAIPHDYGAGSWEAHSVVGIDYQILDVGTDPKNGARYYLRWFAQFDSLDKAKAFAQTDFDNRIRSCLVKAGA